MREDKERAQKKGDGRVLKKGRGERNGKFATLYQISGPVHPGSNSP